MDANCGRCGAGLAPAAVLFDEQGAMICERCLLAEQARASQQQVAAKVQAIAYGGPLLGLTAFFWNPWWLISAAAIGNGIYVFRSLRGSADIVRTGRAAEKLRVAAIAGMVLGGIAAVLQLLRVAGKLGG
jgi:hypothetical protein